MLNDPEERGFTRVPLPFSVTIEAGSQVLRTDPGVDVSASGIAVKTTETLPFGTLCRVRIPLDANFEVDFQGRVVRSTPDGFAVEVLAIELESFELLKQLVRYQADDPARVDREFCSHLGLRDRS